MTEDIRIWEISDGKTLKEIKKSKLDLETRLEQWIKEDIRIVSDDFINIGRQIETDFGGVIDLLCLDRNGDLVIIELKKEKTPRDIVAQVLDYASWVKDLSNERITDIANKYLGTKGPLERAFKDKFDEELPEILNESNKMLIVASEIDSSTERIVSYLADSFSVPINAISFQYFQDDSGKEYLARAFLIEPTKIKPSPKRKPPLNFDDFKEIAEKNGIGELFNNISEELTDFFDKRLTTKSTVGWAGLMGKSMNTIFNILPKESNEKEGLKFYVYIERLSNYLNIERENIIKFLPAEVEEREPWKGAPLAIYGYFKNITEIKKLSEGLKYFKK